jgi:saccharopine dehydrogenase (NAD+, L-lysine-forming)
MRIFVLGAGGTGSLLAHFLARQGHTVWCGDKDVERARRFLGKKSAIPVYQVNARNLWSIVRAGRSCHLLVNASPAVFNEIILRAALRLRAHYLDLNSHLVRNPFKAEQLRYHKRFLAKDRVAVINAGVAPGLTNLLAKRGAEFLDTPEAIYVRLYESTESEDPVSTWSAEAAFDAAISHPRVYRDGRFHLAKRFSGREDFRFPPPIGRVPVFLAAQDEVATLPYLLPIREMDAKIGGEDIARLRRWHRQGKLTRSRGLVAKRFPRTPTPRMVARLIRRGILENARFAAAVLIRGVKKEQPMLIRWDAGFPTLYQIRRRGMHSTPISYATAFVAALFVKHFPRNLAGVFAPEALPTDTRRAIVADARSRDIRITLKITRLKKSEEEEFEM